MISVCIPTYNGEKFIKRQLETILMQLDVKDEVIVSDDSSTDRTIEIIESLNDKRIRIFKNNHFHSPIFNLENALKEVQGDYIFLADQDDIWHEKKVITLLPLLKRYTTVVSDCNIIDEIGNVVEPSFFKINNSKPGFIHNIVRNSYLGCCMAFDHSILDAALPFPKKIAMHDIWLGLITELFGNSLFVKDKLVSYRRHTNNFSPTSQKSHLKMFYKISYRLRFFYYIFFRYLKIKILKKKF